MKPAGRTSRRMEALLSRPREEFLPELKGLVYRNPQTEQWETDDKYLLGDVRTKLQNARAAAATVPSYQENITALEAVQPADLTATDIDARLGAVWIPPGDVEAFAKALLGNEGINVSHAAAVGTWFIKGDYGARATIANSTEWGTGRYSALELIQDALNLKTPTVYDTDPRTKSSVIKRRKPKPRATGWRCLPCPITCSRSSHLSCLRFIRLRTSSWPVKTTSKLLVALGFSAASQRETGMR
jgi:N12 class adenine-specific DNA methylase